MDNEAKQGELRRVESVVRSNLLARWVPRIAIALVLLVLVAGAIALLGK